MDIEKVTELFGRKRSIEILELLDREDELNFKDVEDRIPSSSDTISSTLNVLIDCGLVDRNQQSVIDVRYRITPRGRDVLGKIKEIGKAIQKDE